MVNLVTRYRLLVRRCGTRSRTTRALRRRSFSGLYLTYLQSGERQCIEVLPRMYREVMFSVVEMEVW